MRKGKTAMKILGTTSLGMGLVIVLFLSSERQVHRNNAFTRRYPPHPVIKKYGLNLGFNSYYVSGFDKNVVYLGNTTAPLHLLKINLITRDTNHVKLKLLDRKFPYRAVKVGVFPPYFFVMDGTTSIILRGKLGKWKAVDWMDGIAYFNKAIPIDSNKIFIQTVMAKTQKSTLGLLEKAESSEVRLDTSLLEAQIDGVFDVDGTMLLSGQQEHLGYVYRYRNQFLILDPELNILQKRRTIDTVETAQIKVSNLPIKGKVQMSAPPLTINRKSALYHNLIFIQSERLGRNEDSAMLNQASIIDVYDWIRGSYEFSFYLYHSKREKLHDMFIRENMLIALIDDHLITYKLGDHFKPILETKKEKTNNQIHNTTGR